MNGSNYPEIRDLSRELASRAEAFCRHYFPNGHKNGNYWHIGDTSGAKGKSLAIRLNDSSGRKAGNWTDYAGAADEFGDLIDLLHQHLGNINLADTLNEVRAYLGETPSQAKLPSDEDSPAIVANKKIAQARRLFDMGKSTYRTLASTYLLRRGIKRFGPALKYHPSVYVRVGDDDENAELVQHPALLAKITDNDGVMTGCAPIFLNPITKKVADIESPKRVRGQLHGNAVRFGKGKPREDLIVGEGLENTLSVGTALMDEDLASCLTANHLGLFLPPKNVKRLWIARDNDEAGERAAAQLRNRAEQLGLWVGDLIPRTDDYNNDLLKIGVDELRLDLEKAMSEKR